MRAALFLSPLVDQSIKKGIAMNRIIITFFLTLSAGIASAQWTKSSNGLPEQGNTKDLATNDGTLFAALSEGLYASDDRGASWQKKGLTDGKEKPYLQTLCVDGDSMFAGGSDFLYFSKDRGSSWGKHPRMPQKTFYVNSIVCKGANMYIGMYDGLFFSFNWGHYWDEITGSVKRDDFLDEDGDKTLMKSVYGIIVINKDIYMGTSTGVFVTTDRGKSWMPLNKGLPRKRNVTMLQQVGDNFYCSTEEDLFMSSDKGQSWTHVEGGLPGNRRVNAITGSGSFLFAAVWQKGIYVSKDKGATWAEFNEGLPKKFNVWSLLLDKGRLYAGGVANGVWACDAGAVMK